ncbi:MAG: MFS transporter [Chloroflexota bacterium]
MPRTGTAIHSYRWVILTVAVIGQSGLGAPTQAIPVLAHFYRADFAITMAQVGLFTALICLGTALPAIPSGYVTDRVGVRPMLLSGLLCVSASILLLALAPTYAIALPLGFLAGVGHALCSPALALSIVRWFDFKGRGTAMGIKQTGVPLCGALAAAILPAVALAWNWRYAMAGLGLAMMGTAMFAFALYREVNSVEPLKRPTRSSSNLRGMLLNRNIWRNGALAFVLVGAQNSIITYFILYLKDVLLVPVAVAGGLLSLAHLTGLVSRIGGGIVSDVVFGSRRKQVLTISGSMAVCILLLIGLAGADLPGWSLALIAVFIGVSILGWHGVWIALGAELGGRESGGTALGISSTFSQVGGSVIPFIFGLLIDATHSYQVGWVFLALLAGIGTLIFSGVREREN